MPVIHAYFYNSLQINALRSRAWHRPDRQITGMSFYCLKIWHRTFSWSVSRPAEVQPWEVRSAHPCRARARHPIHKAMGGHAFHGHTSDRVFITFQFRAGTIKTLWPRTPISRLLFNSIMVQLELIRTVRACIFFSSFNSIMVQLEHYLLQEQHCDALVSIP